MYRIPIIDIYILAVNKVSVCMNSSIDFTSSKINGSSGSCARLKSCSNHQTNFWSTPLTNTYLKIYCTGICFHFCVWLWGGGSKFEEFPAVLREIRGLSPERVVFVNISILVLGMEPRNSIWETRHCHEEVHVFRLRKMRLFAVSLMDEYYKNKDIKSESYYTKRSCFHRLV